MENLPSPETITDILTLNGWRVVAGGRFKNGYDVAVMKEGAEQVFYAFADTTEGALRNAFAQFLEYQHGRKLTDD
jgi:hypothetical protein